MSQEAIPQQSRTFFLERVFSGLLGAGRQGFWPLVDQGAVSVGNFAILIIVARAVPKNEYGAFGLMLEVIFYLNTVQSALITYPLTVKGVTASIERLQRLASSALIFTVIMVAPVVLAGLGIAALTRSMQLGVAAAFALVAWQAQEVVRRALLTHFRFAEAVIGDGIRYLGTAICLWILWQHGMLTLPRVFCVIGLFSTLAILIQALQVGWRSVGPRDLGRFAREFFITGRWMLFGTLGGVVVSLCGVWAVSGFHGIDVAGEYYAISNFTKPINPLLITFNGLITQHAAKAYASGGFHMAYRASAKFAALTFVLTMPYIFLLMAVPGPAIRLLYGNGTHFDDPVGETSLRWWAISEVILVIVTLIGAFMNGIHRTRDIFYAQIVTSISTVVIGLPATIRFGLLGQLVGGTITAAAQCIAMIWFLLKGAGPTRPPAGPRQRYMDRNSNDDRHLSRSRCRAPE